MILNRKKGPRGPTKGMRRGGGEGGKCSRRGTGQSERDLRPLLGAGGFPREVIRSACRSASSARREEEDYDRAPRSP